LAGADAEARLVPVESCSHGSPVDAVAEGARDAAWLSDFLSGLPAMGEVLESPRIVVARGRLALAEGRFEEAREELRAAVAGFASNGFRLDGWHAGSALAE